MRARKTLIAAGSLAGLLVGGAVHPQAAVPTATGVGLVIWVLTSRSEKSTAPRVPRDIEMWAAPRAHHLPSRPPPASVQRSLRVPSEPPADAAQAELEYLEYANGLLAEAVARELLDEENAERLRALIEQRRQHALRAALATAAAPSAGPPAVATSPPPALPAPPHPMAAAPPRTAVPAPTARPSLLQERVWRVKELIASDVAVHGLAYLGVLLLFAGAFGFTLFSFNSVRVGLRPVAEIAVPAALLGSARFLRRRGAPVVATGLGLVGGLLLPVMLFASFVDGVAFPPELQGTSLAATLTVISLVVAGAYAAYSARHPDASLRYLVAPMVWAGCWAVGLVFTQDVAGRIDLRDWSAGQLAFVSVGVAITAVLPTLRPGLRLSKPLRVSIVPGIAITYMLAIALAGAEGWPAPPVVVAGLAALVTVELLTGYAPGSLPVALLQAAILGVTASALVTGLGYATGGAVTAFAFVALLEWQELRHRGPVARAVSTAGVAVGLGLALTAPWTSVAAFAGVSVWAHVRRAIRFPSAQAGELRTLEAAAALLPAGAAWGLLQIWPDGPVLMALGAAPLAGAAAVRILGSNDSFYAWWTPVTAACVIAGTLVVDTAVGETTARSGQLAAAAALGALAIALSPRWPAARVWATAAALAWAAELAFDAANVAFEYRTVTWSTAGLATVAAGSVRRSDRLAGHVAAVGTLLALAGLAAAPTESVRLTTLGLWTAAWLVMVMDQERGGAPLVALALRAVPGGVPGRVKGVVAAIPAVILVTSLPFLLAAAGRYVDPIADHRSWSGVVLSVLAIGYAASARSLASRRPLSAVLAAGAFALSASGIAVAAPDSWPSIEALAALIVAVWVLGGALRRPIMTWVSWTASGVLVVLLVNRAGVPVRSLPEVVFGWGGALMVGGLVLDDVRSGRRAPGQGLRQAWLTPPVVLGAIAVPIGLAFLFTGTHEELGLWSLVGAAMYLLVALLLRAGSVSAVSYALFVVGVGALTGWSVLDRPWVGAAWAAALVGASLVAAGVKASRDPWVRWDLAPLVIAHGVAAVALTRSLDVGMVPATWSSIGAVSLTLAALRRNLFWAVAGAILVGVGAGAAGPGWLALALAGYSLVTAAVAIRSRGPLRLPMQATSVVLAAASWSQVVVWAGWSGTRTATLTAFLAAAVAVVTGAAIRWARLPADWAGSLAGLSVAGELAVVGLWSAPSSSLDPHTGAVLLALVTASLSAGAGLAARPLAADALREACALLVAGAGLLLGYGMELEPGPLTGWWAATAIAGTVWVLGLWRARPSSPWVRPLALLGAAGSVLTIVVAASALPRRDLLEVALSVAGVQTAALGIALRRPEPLYLSPLLFCAAWLLFASEALTGEAQWFTVPIGIAVLSVVGIGRAARRRTGMPVTMPELLSLEYVGMAFVVGDGLVESIVTSPVRGLFALAFGVCLAAWGALTKVRRRALFGAGAAVLAVALILGGPIARLVPTFTGPALWVMLAVAGVVLIAVATGLERGRAKVAAAMRRLDTLMEGWE